MLPRRRLRSNDPRALTRPLPGILLPLRHRDYRLLAIGSLVSLLGDGFFFWGMIDEPVE